MVWHAAREPLTRTDLLRFPDGIDLLPVLGGWLDIAVAGTLARVLEPVVAYNLTAGLYLWIAGVGMALLARSMESSVAAAVVAGLLLQMDGFVLHHLLGGRPEQVGAGFAALALAAIWRTLHGRLSPVWAAAAVGLLLTVSWELSLIVALAALWMLPFTLRSQMKRPLLRLALAVGVICGPWVGSFLARSGSVRAMDEGSFALETMLHASAPPLAWLLDGRTLPPRAALVSLLALPWLGLPRRMVAGVALGLAAALVVAAGPAPGLWTAGEPAAWAPLSWGRHLPLLGWFHWPDRLLVVFNLAAPLTAALVIDRVARRRRRTAAALAVAAVLVTGAERHHQQLWPFGGFALAPHDGALALSELPSGAVLDLPRQPDPVHHLRYQLIQMQHGHPIVHDMILSHLGPSVAPATGALMRWFVDLMGPIAPEPLALDAEMVAELQEQGVGYVVLHKDGWPLERWALARRVLADGLGTPTLRQGDGWLCWELITRP